MWLLDICIQTPVCREKSYFCLDKPLELHRIHVIRQSISIAACWQFIRIIYSKAWHLAGWRTLAERWTSCLVVARVAYKCTQTCSEKDNQSCTGSTKYAFMCILQKGTQECGHADAKQTVMTAAYCATTVQICKWQSFAIAFSLLQCSNIVASQSPPWRLQLVDVGCRPAVECPAVCAMACWLLQRLQHTGCRSAAAGCQAPSMQLRAAGTAAAAAAHAVCLPDCRCTASPGVAASLGICMSIRKSL